MRGGGAKTSPVAVAAHINSQPLPSLGEAFPLKGLIKNYVRITMGGSENREYSRRNSRSEIG